MTDSVTTLTTPPLPPIDTAPWMVIAMKEIGVAEVPGPKDNPRILEYDRFTYAPADHDEIPWCSAFVNFCMIKAGIMGTRSAAARSWMNWGVPLKDPKYGAVTVFKRGDSTWEGHVGFYVGEDKPGCVKILGGNQGNRVCIEEFLKSPLLGYRWPGEKKK